MIIRLANERDFPGFLALAGPVEKWFGPMVEVPGFRRAVDSHIRQGTALVADTPEDGLVGGLLFGASDSVHHIHWLVVSQRHRATGAGRALVEATVDRFVTGPGVLEVITFGADHPGAVDSGARVFYERLGFTPAEPADPGPEGGSRQVYRRVLG